MAEQSINELLRDAATAAATAQPETVTFQPEAINLLEVMEICSDLCARASAAPSANPGRHAPPSPEITPPPIFAEIMSLKISEVSADDWSKYIDCPKQ